ncbi:hypothetical protein SAMN02983003_0704 [Devosia enhydra]|uniref:Uncharacterized protein n=1 Tax=Devosia enhydra TaxID=665118 RepID=A0A1K2HUL2_9HYPH|nr:hypothetical protein SAMN02983003_0704 [Devosia enhydra]
MQELQAHLQLLIERRRLLATVASREHRTWTEDEIDELASLNGAIDAVIYTIRELSPPPQHSSQP